MRRALFVVSAALALWLAPGALASGWCGAGETAIDRPDAVAGAQVHVIVAAPADGVDNFAAEANTVADDIASMSAWWVGQDPTRVPRYDLANFPGGTCLDISYVRLPSPASAYQGSSVAFGLLRSQLEAMGFFNFYKDYVVYYDGPAVSPDVCGTGQGTFDQGQGYAVVWLNGCASPPVPTDGIEAHELLHAFGALPAGAPNACTPATDPFKVFDPGHPCDSPSDVLYPVTDGRPLQDMVLDFNHDDYYGHSGTWPDIRNVIFLRHLDTPQVPLTVSFSGSGAVASDLPGLACTLACTTQWDQGTNVTLSASPANGSRFVRWSGVCLSTASCSLDLTQATSVTAVFAPATVAVRLLTTGKGKIVCSPACSKTVSAGAGLRLRAAPAQGWKFLHWSGTCTGTAIACSPHTDAAVTVRATFKKLPVHRPVKKKR